MLRVFVVHVNIRRENNPEEDKSVRTLLTSLWQSVLVKCLYILAHKSSFQSNCGRSDDEVMIKGWGVFDGDSQAACQSSLSKQCQLAVAISTSPTWSTVLWRLSDVTARKCFWRADVIGSPSAGWSTMTCIWVLLFLTNSCFYYLDLYTGTRTFHF